MIKNRDEFIQKNSPCGGFLQSNQWLKFQNSFGINFHNISDKNFWSNILEYKLPLAGKYFYIPRGPVLEKDIAQEELKNIFNDLIFLAKSNQVNWIRIDNFNSEIESVLKKEKINFAKAPHDMQPKQIFVIDIEKNEEEILSEMKPKTRYNIKLAEKKGVKIEAVNEESKNEKLDEFLNLVEKTGARKKINFHPRRYYQEMLKNISNECIKLYLATYQNKIIAGALLLKYGEMATYLHGGSDDEYRNAMAPFLLQWRMIQDAKKMGAKKYDFGGVSIGEENQERQQKWAGVTRFKQGFAKNNSPLEFSGSYDIILNPVKYKMYRLLQKIRSCL